MFSKYEKSARKSWTEAKLHLQRWKFPIKWLSKFYRVYSKSSACPNGDRWLSDQRVVKKNEYWASFLSPTPRQILSNKTCTSPRGRKKTHRSVASKISSTSTLNPPRIQIPGIRFQEWTEKLLTRACAATFKFPLLFHENNGKWSIWALKCSSAPKYILQKGLMLENLTLNERVRLNWLLPH